MKRTGCEHDFAGGVTGTDAAGLLAAAQQFAADACMCQPPSTPAHCFEYSGDRATHPRSYSRPTADPAAAS